MRADRNLLAIGRSRYLYDSIKHLASQGYTFKAIVTEEAYEEYDVKHHDFQELASRIGARFFMTKSLYSDELVKLIKDNNVRVAISANWKYVVPKGFLDLFECGILNFHLGNLPDYKGNATVNWSIINGEKHINGNIHKMDPELDAGDVVSREAIPIEPDTYITDIIKRAEQAAPSLYEDAVRKVLENPAACEVKGSVRGLRCYPRLPEDSQIDWHQSVEEVYRLIRASAHPYHGAFSFLNGEKIIIWKAKPYITEDKFLVMPGHVVALQKDTSSILAACKDGLLEVQEIEHEGIKMPPTEFIKSIRVRFKHVAYA
ncbi:methionyl-tRNA formyltransferase [Pontibacter ummariensis]|uniref:Methionyl-tRNA formyltransferase n=1 Tax=Pontibacter ummariensis TaxID=1610492 RepID=A0A239K3F6_9BACT|nr:formyltransferase family protein [Pontibacter ummariensis]PRY06775.1 methionyl-tRNA formyltransferase [Pontibacter ummariensis]SNT12906.1 methionyl-tRNA formyltransferase [Pontibacter ummariensis]